MALKMGLKIKNRTSQYNDGYIPVDTRRRFNVYTTFIRRRIDVEATSCVYWDVLSNT